MGVIAISAGDDGQTSISIQQKRLFLEV